MGIKLVKNNGNLNLTAPAAGMVIQGEDGGYYIPTVDENGILTWTPTKETMEAVAEANIKGKDGAPGKDGKDGIDGSSGIYVGTTAPTDSEALIWINPDGEEPAEYATKEYVDEAVKNIEIPEPDLTGYATEQYVNNAIAAIPVPDVGITEAEVETMLIPYVKEEQLNTKLIEYATEQYVIETVTAQGYQNENQVKALITAALEEVENGSY